MKNPNAFVAFIATQITLGIMWLLQHQHYIHYVLTPYRQAWVTGSIITLILLIGKDGIKGGAQRLWAFVKKFWTGFGDQSPFGQLQPLEIDDAKAAEMLKAQTQAAETQQAEAALAEAQPTPTPTQ